MLVAIMGAFGVYAFNAYHQRSAYKAGVPVCVSDAECEAARMAARSWVLANSPFDIEYESASTIRTKREDPQEFVSKRMAIEVNFERTPHGQRITFVGRCNYLYGCDQWVRGAEFNDAISRAIEAAAK